MYILIVKLQCEPRGNPVSARFVVSGFSFSLFGDFICFWSRTYEYPTLSPSFILIIMITVCGTGKSERTRRELSITSTPTLA